MAKLSTRDLKHLRALAATDARLLSGAASVDIKLLAALLEEYDRADALAAQVAQREYAIKAWKEEEALWKEREAAQVARVRELEAALDTIAELSLDNRSRNAARQARGRDRTKLRI